MRILIVDDERLASRRLEILLARRPQYEVVGVARDGEEALQAIEQHRPDVVLLDIHMPGTDGILVSRKLAGPDSPAVIFVTAFEHHAADAFESAAIDYLLKPVSPERLDTALARVRNLIYLKDAQSRVGELESVVAALRGGDDGSQEVIWVRSREGMVRIPKRTIDWVEAEGDYVRLHCREKSWLHRETLSAMGKTLGDRLFIRVHRSAIVNKRRIVLSSTTGTGGRIVRLDTGAEVRVGRSYGGALREALDQGTD
ncbi:LytR/AlgR family response regulator transcription factor [Maricaulis salignorans]|uniref:Two component transcriptional regulator, LytTR family n=1 Tax=Maricaulis salignorans TaxID=144026 RepID=A0A1G9LMU8_9PROT|nr:LytTR family DNA-binding domain-containing protein [Maricaulis salignorans]SDL63248.1 two component transcriptional regulator, LytTR family [Maricaulis salignorans]